jgi:hypothetical protein
MASTLSSEPSRRCTVFVDAEPHEQCEESNKSDKLTGEKAMGAMPYTTRLTIRIVTCKG